MALLGRSEPLGGAEVVVPPLLKRKGVVSYLAARPRTEAVDAVGGVGFSWVGAGLRAGGIAAMQQRAPLVGPVCGRGAQLSGGGGTTYYGTTYYGTTYYLWTDG